MAQSAIFYLSSIFAYWYFFWKKYILYHKYILTLYMHCVTIMLIMEVIIMSKTDTLSIRIEPTLKKEVEETLNYLGMNVADAVTIFLRQVVLNDGIPFEIKKPKYNKETIDAINEVKEMLKNPEKYESYNSVKELMEDLNN